MSFSVIERHFTIVSPLSDIDVITLLMAIIFFHRRLFHYFAIFCKVRYSPITLSFHVISAFSSIKSILPDAFFSSFAEQAFTSFSLLSIPLSFVGAFTTSSHAAHVFFGFYSSMPPRRCPLFTFNASLLRFCFIFGYYCYCFHGF